jgi:hypothetical protein
MKYALFKVEDEKMKHERAPEVLSILMASELYFEFTLAERLALLKSVLERMN